ncbi:MAG TPA: AAA family ATPase, partial [Gemmatimonadaceae bacterium]|nr:AAA family ATPase [Gemmatimonadaceae bacterium]
MIHLHSLGQCMITVGATRLLPSAKLMFASALYVAMEGTRSIARDAMTAIFWPGADEELATHSLRQTLYRLRAQGLPVSGEGERLVLPAGLVRTDFDELLAPESELPVGAMLERIPGGFLPGYSPTISRPFADWVESQRARVHAGLRRRLVGGIATLRAAGDWPAVEKLAQRCLELDPLNEEATLAYAESLAMDGSKARAIMIIDRYMNEIGPRPRALHEPALALKKRIAGLYPLPPVIERDPPQIGREEEMAKLDAALKEARQGRGGAFLITGPPGMGKTRLVTEFTRAAQLQGIPIAKSQMGRNDAHRPIGAWSDLVPPLQRMPGALGCDPESLPYLRRLTTWDATQTTPSAEAQDAEYLFARIRLSVLDLVSAVASEHCMILLVEDVHWMDQWSWDVMSALTKRLEQTGVLVLMTRRESDEEATPVPKDAVLRMMPLAPLDDARCRTLLGAVAPAKRVAEGDFAEWCVRTCAGNPYFLIELGRRAKKAEGKYQAPSSLTKLIAERFLDVAPLSQRVLQAAAVLGKNSTLARVEQVLGERRIGLMDALDELGRRALVVADGERLVCRHDLLGMSALENVSEFTIRALHLHAARVLEDELGEHPDPAQLWDCAEHLLRAQEHERALRILERCADRALQAGTPADAVRVLEIAISLKHPRGELDRLQKRRLHALYVGHEFRRIVDAYPDLESHANRLGRGEHDHDEHELRILDSHFVVFGARQSVLRHAIQCASSTLADADHRVEAGLIGL